MGHYCCVYSTEVFFQNPSFNYDVYVFHRPTLRMANPPLPRILDILKSKGSLVIADYDDLIFGSEKYALESSLVKNKRLTPEEAIKIYEINTYALCLFDHVTTSTAPLAVEAHAYNSNARVRVMPNIIPSSIYTLHEHYGTAFRPRKDTVIGYFPGTKSHDLDVLIVENVLVDILSKEHSCQLFVVGPVALPKALKALPNVTRKLPVDYLDLFNVMSKCSVVLAPLEASLFNQCKSRVKFLEAAVAGCHLVASPIDDMKQVGPHRLTLVETEADWFNALSSVKPHAARRKEIESNLEFIKKHDHVNDFISWS